MKLFVKKNMFEQVLRDLERPHEFAYERVGYFYGDFNIFNQHLVITDWFSFRDHLYERTASVGARIGREGMKSLMALALKSKKSFVQFHLHEFQREPEFSYADIKSLQEVIPALFSFSEVGTHAALIKGSEFMTSLAWCPNVREPKKNTFRTEDLFNKNSEYL